MADIRTLTVEKIRAYHHASAPPLRLPPALRAYQHASPPPPLAPRPPRPPPRGCPPSRDYRCVAGARDGPGGPALTGTRACVAREAGGGTRRRKAAKDGCVAREARATRQATRQLGRGRPHGRRETGRRRATGSRHARDGPTGTVSPARDRPATRVTGGMHPDSHPGRTRHSPVPCAGTLRGRSTAASTLNTNMSSTNIC